MKFCITSGINHIYGSVVAERLRAPNSNSGVSDQQSVGFESQSSCVVKQDTFASSFGWDAKELVLCVV